MKKEQVDALLTDVKTLKEILGDFTGAYSLGVVTYSNDDGNPELFLLLGAYSDNGIAKEITRSGTKIKIFVKTGYIPPVPYNE